MTKHIASLGEILMRLKTPGHQRFTQAKSFEATFGGAETNVAVSLAQLGCKSSMISSVPNNALGDTAINELRYWGVKTRLISRNEGRLGLYFMENGADHRSGQVVYDRENSVFCKFDALDQYPSSIFKNIDWLHLSGISPATSENAANFCLEIVKRAKSMGTLISLDLNFRSKLWTYGKTPQQIMPAFLELTDVLIAGRGDCQQMLDIHGQGDPNSDHYFESLSDTLMALYPNLHSVAISIRETLSAESHRWKACLNNGEQTYFSKSYEIHNIVDRVGTGDAFAAGLIYGLINNLGDLESLNFSAAANCLKHSIQGDFNIASLKEIESLANENAMFGHMQR